MSSNERNFFCKVCKRSFKRQAALENHKRVSHPSDQEIIKAKCLERLPGKRALAKIAKDVKAAKKAKAAREARKTAEKEVEVRRFLGHVVTIPKTGKYSSCSTNLQKAESSLTNQQNAVDDGQQISQRFVHSQIRKSEGQQISQRFDHSQIRKSEGNESLVEIKNSQSLVEFSKIIDHQVKSLLPVCDENSNRESSHGQVNLTQNVSDQVSSAVMAKQSTDKEKVKKDKRKRRFDVIVNEANRTYNCFSCKSYLSTIGSLMNHMCSAKASPTKGICIDCHRGPTECLCGQHIIKVTLEERSIQCAVCKRWFPNEIVLNNHGCPTNKKEPPKQYETVLQKVEQSFGQQNTPESTMRDNESRKTPVKCSLNFPDKKHQSFSKLDSNSPEGGNVQRDSVIENEQNNQSQEYFVKCLYCQEVFSEDFQLCNHMLMHKELTHFDCFFCNKVFSTGFSLKEHLKIDHGHHLSTSQNGQPEKIQTETGIRFRCAMCPETFSCRSNKQRHEYRHFGLRPYRCELCGAFFRQKWQLGSHRQSKRCIENRMKTEVQEQDAVSQIETSSQVDMKTKLEIQSSVETMSTIGIKCLDKSLPDDGIGSNRIVLGGIGSLLGQKFEQVAPIASTSKPATSPIEGSMAPELTSVPTTSITTDASVSSESMNLDLKSEVMDIDQDSPLDLTKGGSSTKKGYSENGIKCKECGKVCKNLRNLGIHRRIHTGERPYGCHVCGMTFRQSHHRKNHMRSMHGITYSNLPQKSVATQEIVVMTEGGIRYKCHLCNKVLMSKSGRRKHERWHLGLRPHRCSICGYMFKQLQHLKKHEASAKCRAKRLMIPSPKKDKMEDRDPSAIQMPLTYQNLIRRATLKLKGEKENARKYPLPENDMWEALEMPDVLGLISVEKLTELKDEQRLQREKEEELLKKMVEEEEEERKKREEESKRDEQGNDENDITKNTLNPDNVVSSTEENMVTREAIDSRIKEERMSDDGTSKNHTEDYDGEESNLNGNRSFINNLTNTGSPESNTPGMLHLPQQCKTCGQFFGSKKTLREHMQIHTEQRPYVCPYCPRRFIQANNLGSHVKSMHKSEKIDDGNCDAVGCSEGSRTYSCKYCPRHFSLPHLLGAHVKCSHGAEKAREKIEKARAQIKKRGNAIIKEKKYACKHCPRMFSLPHHLGAHMKSRHMENKMEHQNKNPESEDEGIMMPEGLRFKCRHCTKLLTSRNGRKKHETWHLGLRPFECDVCGKSFKQSHHMKRHRYGLGCIPPNSAGVNSSTRNNIAQCTMEDGQSSEHIGLAYIHPDSAEGNLSMQDKTLEYPLEGKHLTSNKGRKIHDELPSTADGQPPMEDHPSELSNDFYLQDKTSSIKEKHHTDLEQVHKMENQSSCSSQNQPTDLNQGNGTEDKPIYYMEDQPTDMSKQSMQDQETYLGEDCHIEDQVLKLTEKSLDLKEDNENQVQDPYARNDSQTDKQNSKEKQPKEENGHQLHSSDLKNGSKFVNQSSSLPKNSFQSSVSEIVSITHDKPVDYSKDTHIQYSNSRIREDLYSYEELPDSDNELSNLDQLSDHPQKSNPQNERKVSVLPVTGSNAFERFMITPRHLVKSAFSSSVITNSSSSASLPSPVEDPNGNVTKFEPVTADSIS